MTWPESPFWDYSLCLYGRPCMEATCLELQRRHGLDVNLLLFACWLASQGIELDQETLIRAKKAVSTWHIEVVRPLRALRRRLAVRLDHAKPESLIGRWPGEVARLRQDVLALELDGEHLAQLALTDVGADLQSTQKAGPELAAANLARVWHFQPDDIDDLRLLLQQAFPATTEQRLAKALSSIAG